MCYQLQPLKGAGFDLKSIRSATPNVAKEDELRKLFSNAHLKEAMATYHSLRNTSAVKASSSSTATPKTELDAFDIILFGTGAANSSSYRNGAFFWAQIKRTSSNLTASVSILVFSECGMLIDIYKHGCLLLDCGSNTYSQMSHRFGPDTKKVLKRLKAIWLSHRHPDHHAGLLQILLERQRARTSLLSEECVLIDAYF